MLNPTASLKRGIYRSRVKNSISRSIRNAQQPIKNRNQDFLIPWAQWLFDRKVDFLQELSPSDQK
jgi:hypothetical protein